MVIFLTGATGFVGSHVARELDRQGHALILGKRSTSDTWRIADLLPRIPCADLDLLPYDRLFSGKQIECIVHCATTYNRDESDLELPLSANVLFPLRLLLNGAAHGVKYFVNTDSFFTKPNLMEKVDPYMGGYSYSKEFFFEYGRFAALKNGMKFINMRLEHVYGDWDNAEKFIPRIIKQCRENVKVIPLSQGIQKRDFVHVSDVASAYSVVVKELSNMEMVYAEYQVGTGKATPLRTFVEFVKDATKSDSELMWGMRKMNPGEIMCSYAENKSLVGLGWKPQIAEENQIKNCIEKLAL